MICIDVVCPMMSSPQKAAKIVFKEVYDAQQ